MQRITGLALVAGLSATLAVMPIGVDLNDPLNISLSSAHAGKGNGNGGGNGGGNGNGKSEGKSSSGQGKSRSSARGSSEAAKSKNAIATAIGTFFGTSKTEEKAASKKRPMKTAVRSQKTKNSVLKIPKPLAKPENPALVADTAVLDIETTEIRKSPALAAKLGRLNSLNRNYHAFLNANDPHMAAIRAYVVAYAQFELDNGADALPADPALSDDALSAALLSAANKNITTTQEPGSLETVDPDVLEWAKDVLGVGPAVGKIDQVRDGMASETSEEEQAEEVVETEPSPGTEEGSEPADPDVLPVAEQVAVVE